MKFYQSKEFKILKTAWYEHLEGDGFDDLEDKKENLKQHDRRTIAWENKELILDFFLSLDHFMHLYEDMPRFERSVMTLYSQGYHVPHIALHTKASKRNVKYVVARYKGLIKAIDKLKALAPFPEE